MMEWYSIKKYTPPSCTQVFIRAINGEYDRYFVGIIENFNLIAHLIEWELEGDYSIDYTEWKVTHFAIINPLEIQE